MSTRTASRGNGTPRALALAGCVSCIVLLAGCGRDSDPQVRVVNASGRRLDALWVRTQHDSVRVPPLAPGDSVSVRLRVKGEDLVWLTGKFAGRRLDSHGGDYVEGSGGYRFRAVVDSAGHADMRFVRMGIW